MGMRMYLSSFRIGDHPGRLLELAGHGARIAVIANALDSAPDDIRRAGVEREVVALGALGLHPEELDLRRPDAVHRLTEFGAVWVRGGNVFVLREALARSGADHVLPDLIRHEDLVYAGYSAGPVVLGPSLRGFDQVDDVSAVLEPIWDGLGVLDRPFVPHVASPGHPETASCDRLSAEFGKRAPEHWALRDGEVLLVDGGGSTMLPRVN